LLLVWFSDVRLKGHFSRIGSNDHLNIQVRALYGVIRVEYVIPIMKLQGLKGLMIEREKNQLQEEQKTEWIDKGKIVEFYQKAKLMLTHTDGLTEWLKQTMKQFRCTELRWTTRLGLKDAPGTAILSGVVWGLKSSIIHILAKNVKMQVLPVLHVFPLYNRLHFSTEVMVAGHIRAGTAIWAGLKLLRRISKAKGGLKTWQRLMSSKPSS
jgi:hypothetical protein